MFQVSPAVGCHQAAVALLASAARVVIVDRECMMSGHSSGWETMESMRFGSGEAAMRALLNSTNEMSRVTWRRLTIVVLQRLARAGRLDRRRGLRLLGCVTGILIGLSGVEQRYKSTQRFLPICYLTQKEEKGFRDLTFQAVFLDVALSRRSWRQWKRPQLNRASWNVVAQPMFLHIF